MNSSPVKFVTVDYMNVKRYAVWNCFGHDH